MAEVYRPQAPGWTEAEYDAELTEAFNGDFTMGRCELFRADRADLRQRLRDAEQYGASQRRNVETLRAKLFHRDEKLKSAEEQERGFGRMLERDAAPESWELWRMAFLAAMDTPASWRSFLCKIRDGTALDWWVGAYRDRGEEPEDGEN